ncbi:MAG TPA: ribosome small subunit-dependent GTPase A [Candidatus Limnocylindrales bacterium]|nr:ribosome small subunit-dependent GTPase A [Candidatus Limnocylindrales bacterium]
MSTFLASLGWTGRMTVPAGLEPGRVARTDRGICTVLTATGPVRASLGGAVMTAAASDPVALASTGDWVALRRWPDDRITIEAVLPRRSAIVRRTAGKDATGQVLAANVDTAAVVASLDPAPELATIERLLALAWDSGAKPYLILTKADLVAYPQALVEELSEIAPAVPVVAVSAVRGDGIGQLRPLVSVGRTLGLIGASGAGKSRLVNALAGDEVMPTQAIRRADGKGRHTTTFRALVPVPGGGAVLDTPGLRAVGLLDGVGGLDRTFKDVLDLAQECQFPDCRHEGEPGCAIALALASGELSHRRWASWLKLLREIEFEQRRNTARVISRPSTRRPGQH